MRLSGGCLCGAVRFQGEAEPQFQINCYCTDCRKLGGGHASWMDVPAEAVSITGAPHWYESKSGSGRQVGRAFCPACGVGLFGRNEMMPGMLFVRPSALDDPQLFAPQMSVYGSRAPHWDQPAADLPVFPEMPPMPVEAAR